MSQAVGLGGGGAMYSPAVSPYNINLMFVSCDMGGLYRSIDGGNTWRMVDERQMSASVRCPVIFHPATPGTQPDKHIVYAYGPNRGLRRSNDGGRSWPDILKVDVGGALGITALAIDPDQPNLMFYGTGKVGAWRSTDGGQSWNSISTVSGEVVSIFIDPSSSAPDPTGGGGRRVFIATRVGGVLRSTNSGQTFVPANGGQNGELPNYGSQSSPNRYIRDFAGGAGVGVSQPVLYATTPSTNQGGAFVGGVFRSTDLGATWTRQMSGGINAELGMKDQWAPCAFPEYEFVDVATNDPSVVYATVCGTAYDPQLYPATTPPQPPPPNKSYHSGVYRSKDGGNTWEHIYYYEQANFQKVLNDNSNVSGGWVDWDSGWGEGGPARVWDDNFPDNKGGFTVCQSNSDVVVVTNKMMIYITTKGRTAGAADRSVWMQRYTRQEPERDPTSGNLVLKYPPIGQRWSSVGLEVTTAWNYHVHPSFPKLRYLCYTDIGLAKSSDGGSTWRSTTPQLRRSKPGTTTGEKRPYNTVYELAFDPANPSYIWAAASDQHDIPYPDWLNLRNGGGIAFSDNYGETWSDRSGDLPKTRFGDAPPPVVSILRDPKSGRLWASVFGYGVYSSDNAGQTWIDRSGNLPAASPPTDSSGRLLAAKRNPYRLHLHNDGTLFCALTGMQNQPDPADPKKLTTFTGETGLYRLNSASPGPPAANPQWVRVTPSPASGTNPPDPNNQWWYITDYAVHPENSNETYVCTAIVPKGGEGTGDPSNYVQGAVWKLSGGNWERVLTLAPFGGTAKPEELLPLAYHDSAYAFAPFYDPGDPARQTVYVTTSTHGTWMTNTGASVVSTANKRDWREVTDIPFMSTQRVRFSGVRGSRHVTTFGGGAWEVVKQCYLIMNRSAFSKDEVTAMMGGGQNAPFDDAFFVVLDGLLPSEVAGKSNPNQQEIESARPQLDVTDSSGSTPQSFTVNYQGLLLEDPALPADVPQRFTFVYGVTFTDTVVFPPPPPAGSTGSIKVAFDLKATKGELEGRAKILLETNPAPYMLDIDPQENNPAWLSTDLRVFKVSEEQTLLKQPFPKVTGTQLETQQAMLEGAATKYIKDVLAGMTEADFKGIKGGAVDQDVLPWWRKENGKRVFNFAVARVRYRGTVQAQDVRVFFRLFKVAATGLNYDEGPSGSQMPALSYKRAETTTNEPLLGLRPNGPTNEVVTIPCFADPRVDPAQNMDAQPDSNSKTLTGSGATESSTYYGCWLDFNQEILRFPEGPASPGGPFSGAPLQSIQTLIKDQHQCLVAEIFYTPDPTQFGDTPGTSDNLAQRNLAIDFSANPGSTATRTVQRSFEIAASEIFLDEPPIPTVGLVSSGEELSNDRPWRDFNGSDELIIRWGNLPSGAHATLYLAEIAADEILKLAEERARADYFERVDDNTVRLEVGEITYVPLPYNRRSTTPALFTIELPEDVKYGERYSVVVQQTSMRAVIGTFEFSIPVKEAQELLLGEERKLALLKLVRQATPAEDRWIPVLERSLELAGVRVLGFGGDPSSIPASPDGAPRDRFSYVFRGFFPPVENFPVYNDRKAGSAVPIKFSLSGNQGSNIFAPGYPKSQWITCGSTEPVLGIDPATSPGGSGLSYDSSADQYTYVWKTEKGWAGSCRQLVVKLKDSSFHRANFRFR